MDAQLIPHAIEAHEAWKDRLRVLVEAGRLDRPVEDFAADDRCALGRWIHGDAIGPREREAPEFRRVHACHARFHMTAGRIAELVAAGRAAEAAHLLVEKGVFTQASIDLLDALMGWKAARL